MKLVVRRQLVASLAIVLLIASADAAEKISLDGFRDGIRHWKNGQNVDGYSQYRDHQVHEIADNLLLYQRGNGGWPPNFDPTRVLIGADRQRLLDERDREDTSFDNRSTYTEVDYLVAAFAQTGDARHRDAALRGIEFILAAQYDNGGWPHSYPSKANYRPHVTIVDDVMTGVLRTLRKIDSAEPPYDFIDRQLRQRVAGALRRGDRCLLALQVRVDGQLAGWAAQYDEVTLEPTTGRSFELPALISSESVGVLRYLMSIEEPRPETKAAIHAGVAWLRRSQIDGLRIKRVPAERVRYAHHTSDFDVVAVADSSAPPIWARFYEIDTNRPFMANRDGRKVYRLSEVARERRTGYAWYSNSPERLLQQEFPAWEQKWGQP